MEPSFVTPAVPRRPRSALSLFGDSLRRPGGRRALSLLSVVLFLAAIGLFAYPLATDLYQRELQSSLRNQFNTIGTEDAYRTGKFRIGQGLTRLQIPTIGLDVLVVEGTTPSALRAGAGHYIGTPLPGEAGNVAIAGHRTTFGHPFNHLDEVHPGDEIDLYTPIYEFIYRAVPSFVSVTSFDGTVNPHPVLPTDISVIAAPTDPRVHELTLTTCNPKGSAAQRLVLRAVLVGVRLVPGKHAVLPDIHAPASGAPAPGPTATTVVGPQ